MTDLKHIQYVPQGICARLIEFDIDADGCVHNIIFHGGCDGNHKGLARLAEGQPASNVAQCLCGVDCRGRGTSCPDQLSRALAEIAE